MLSIIFLNLFIGTHIYAFLTFLTFTYKDHYFFKFWETRSVKGVLSFRYYIMRVRIECGPNKFIYFVAKFEYLKCR
jgi:hypothetical protein